MRLRTLLYTLAVVLFCSAAMAETVIGTVTNRTNNKPAVGDDVVLLNVAGMQEIQHVKTDAKGHFTLDVPADGFHLLRITHDKANYFSPVQPGAAPLAIDVYTAADKVVGITLDADVMRIQSDASGANLRVIEHFFEKNDSSPPETLNGDRSFVVFLPPGATVEGAAAKAPGGLAVQTAVQPTGEPNQYAVSFPVRPGETEFQFTYLIPYKGSMEFKPRPVIATDNLVVMMPKSMTFKPLTGTPYVAVTEEPSAQTYVARNVQPSQPLGFTISGTGQLPRDAGAPVGAAATAGAAGPQDPTQAGSTDSNQDHRPGVGLANPLDNAAERESWVSKYKWVLIGGIGLLFVVGAAVLLSTGGAGKSSLPGAVPGAMPATQAGAVLDVLRNEMFAVETERLEGKLTEEQYQELKTAFDVVLRRALARSTTI